MKQFLELVIMQFLPSPNLTGQGEGCVTKTYEEKSHRVDFLEKGEYFLGHLASDGPERKEMRR